MSKTANGMKYDDEKPMMDLIPPEVLAELGKVLTYGANKYAPNNWQSVETYRYIAALLRHYLAWHKGEIVDPESGLHHTTHMLANVSFLVWKEQNGKAEASRVRPDNSNIGRIPSPVSIPLREEGCESNDKKCCCV